MPEPVSDLENMARTPDRFRVWEVSAGKKGKTQLVVVDKYREEMIGFADEALRDRYVKQLLAAGAEFKRLV